MKKRLSMVLMAAGCLLGSAAAVQAEEVKVMDMAGREIVLNQQVKKVVALSAADCEILYALGAEDTLVGRGEYCDYPEKVQDIPSVQSGADTNIEQILALQPDVLVMSYMAQTDEQIAALENAGVKVVISDAQDLEGVYTAIGLMGDVLGKETEAEKLQKEMKDTFEDLQKKAAEKNPQSIYFEVSPLEWGLWAAGKNTFMDEIAKLLNLENIFDDVDGWAEISEEQVLQRAPENIVTITMYTGEGELPEDEIAGRTGWEEIPAVVNHKILNLANNELSRPSPRLADGARMLYDFVYGEEQNK